MGALCCRYSRDAMEPPLSVIKFGKILNTILTEEGLSKGLGFVPSPTDVIISTGSKCGTTWMQMICHALRSGGDMDFEEISLVVPCLEMAHDYGYTDLQMPQPYVPRMFKTHLWHDYCPKGAGKYIILCRKPADAAVSFYYFGLNWVYTKDLSIEDLIDWVLLRKDLPDKHLQLVSTFHHIVSWYPHRSDENVLWLHYEDLKQNLRACVRLTAGFLNIGKDDDKLQELATQQASFEFMQSHRNKFDEHPIKWARNEAVGLLKEAGLNGGNFGKVRSGQTNESKKILSKRTLQKFEDRWKEVVMPKTGYPSYDAMRKGINKELGRDF